MQSCTVLGKIEQPPNSILLLNCQECGRNVCGKLRSNGSHVYFQNMSASFEIGVIYMFKIVRTLNFQMVTVTIVTIFEILDFLLSQS